MTSVLYFAGKGDSVIEVVTISDAIPQVRAVPLSNENIAMTANTATAIVTQIVIF